MQECLLEEMTGGEQEAEKQKMNVERNLSERKGLEFSDEKLWYASGYPAASVPEQKAEGRDDQSSRVQKTVTRLNRTLDSL